MLWFGERNFFKKNQKSFCLLVVNMIFVISLLINFCSTAFGFDFSDWNEVLKKNVNPKVISGVKFNAVNYKNIKNDAAYKRLILDLKGFKLSKLKTKEDKLAFWINIYNVMAVKIVLDNYPLKSIKDAGSLFKSVWNKEVGEVANKIRTLNDIEHEILRKMGEPRIHVAIVCASISCPDLRSEAYMAEKVDAQLNDQLVKFLANEGKGFKIDLGENKFYLSSIFKWFEDDFASKGGVFSYLTKYIEPRYMSSWKSRKLKRKYLEYDWGLNE